MNIIALDWMHHIHMFFHFFSIKVVDFIKKKGKHTGLHMLALVQRKQFCSHIYSYYCSCDVVVNCHLNQPLFCILFLDFFFFCLVGFKLSLRLSWLRHIALIERPRIEISTLASW